MVTALEMMVMMIVILKIMIIAIMRVIAAMVVKLNCDDNGYWIVVVMIAVKLFSRFYLFLLLVVHLCLCQEVCQEC